MVEHRIWRIRTDQELWELYKNIDIIGDIKKKRFEWFGYLARMIQGRTYKKIFEIKPEG
jgi:hypothetical protein